MTIINRKIMVMEIYFVIRKSVTFIVIINFQVIEMMVMKTVTTIACHTIN